MQISCRGVDLQKFGGCTRYRKGRDIRCTRMDGAGLWRRDRYTIIWLTRGILIWKRPRVRRERHMSAGIQDFVMLTGIIIKAEPIGEYDRRVVLLTKERGKISAFAKGSRRPGNRLMAPTNPFSFGQFKLYAGRSAYNMSDAEITNYFEELRQDFAGAYYGMYFLEICDYYTRENNDELGMLKLIYQSLRALTSPNFDNRLVRYIFELKSIMINGEFPGFDAGDVLMEPTAYTVDYIMKTPVEKLFSFQVRTEVLDELGLYSRKMCKRIMDRDFKSLEILENIN
jgi:DNA repair protein RecO (recombination protein O)